MLFIQNKYTKWYNLIISNAQTRSKPHCYTEKHHIIPKSLGGTNNKDNIVVLTAREHFICHWLLTKMISSTNAKYKIGKAFNRMIVPGNKYQSRYTPKSGRIFELCRIACNREMKGYAHSDETKKKIGIKSSQKIMPDSAKETIRNFMIQRNHNMTSQQKAERHERMIHKNPSFDSSVNEKQSKAKKAWWDDPKNKKRGISSRRKRGPYSTESRQKMSKTKLAFFANTSLVERQQTNVYKCSQLVWVCNHCAKQGKGSTNYKRWHGDNCKHKPDK